MQTWTWKERDKAMPKTNVEQTKEMKGLIPIFTLLGT
jgi:hypothetical protein